MKRLSDNSTCTHCGLQNNVQNLKYFLKFIYNLVANLEVISATHLTIILLSVALSDAVFLFDMNTALT